MKSKLKTTPWLWHVTAAAKGWVRERKAPKSSVSCTAELCESSRNDQKPGQEFETSKEFCQFWPLAAMGLEL